MGHAAMCWSFRPVSARFAIARSELRFNDRIPSLAAVRAPRQAEQNRVFSQSGAGMRVVLATNVAETCYGSGVFDMLSIRVRLVSVL